MAGDEAMKGRKENGSSKQGEAMGKDWASTVGEGEKEGRQIFLFGMRGAKIERKLETLLQG